MYIKNIKDLTSNKAYTNMTIREHNFELLDSNSNNSYTYNKNGTLISEAQLEKNYIILTYNDKDNIYIISACGHTNHFEKLGSDYKKIDNFVIKPSPSKLMQVNDISFDKTNSKYLVVDDKNVYSVDKDGNFLKDEIFTGDLLNNSHCNYYNHNCCSKSQCDCCCDDCYTNTQCDCSPDPIFTAVGSDGVYKYVTYTKNCSTYLAKFSQNGSLICTMFIDDNVDVFSIVIDNGFYLGVNKNNKNYIYEIGEGTPGSIIDPRISDILDKIITQLDIIATSEISISSLINAETDKIKKILEISTNPNEILAVNNSVKDVVKEITTLEVSEKDNLSVLLECLKELEIIIKKINE